MWIVPDETCMSVLDEIKRLAGNLMRRSLTLFGAHAVHEREASKKTGGNLVNGSFAFFYQIRQQHARFNYNHKSINGVTHFAQFEDPVKKIFLH